MPSIETFSSAIIPAFVACVVLWGLARVVYYLVLLKD